jgi:tetratricopeptide (TPR) repeat protein
VQILAAMIGQNPADNQLRRRLAVFHGNLANLYHWRLKDDVKARRAYGQALEIQQDLTVRDPAQVGFKNDVAMTCNNLALMIDDSAESLRLLDRALVIRKELAGKEPTNPQYRRNLARTHQNIGVFQLGQGRVQEGLDSLRESCRLLEEVVADHPAATLYQGDLAQALLNLGDTLTVNQHADEAKAKLAHSKTIYQKLLHSNPNDAAFRDGLRQAESALANAEKLAEQLPSPASARPSPTPTSQ